MLSPPLPTRSALVQSVFKISFSTAPACCGGDLRHRKSHKSAPYEAGYRGRKQTDNCFTKRGRSIYNAIFRADKGYGYSCGAPPGQVSQAVRRARRFFGDANPVSLRHKEMGVAESVHYNFSLHSKQCSPADLLCILRDVSKPHFSFVLPKEKRVLDVQRENRCADLYRDMHNSRRS